MTYDIAGRPKKYRNNNVEWNGSQMTKYGRNIYEYDGNNYRVFKQTPTEKTYYNYDGSGNLRFERRGRTEINYIYDAGGIRGMKVTVPTDDPSTYYASSEFYYVKDSLGNIRVILDKSGNIMVEYNYDAWGNFIAEKVREVSIGSVTVDLAELNAFTYRGYYYDKESGLYYLINRYYDPTTGRFISPDDVGYLDFESFFGTNRYAYCLDDPVNESDPDGSSPILSIILGITALIGIGLTIGGVASGNNTLTAVGLTMVAIPALISGGMAIVAGIGGATLTGIVGGVTVAAGIGSGLFASAEYQEAFTGNNWMLDAGMSESWYNGLMLTTATIATLGTFASSFCYNFNIKSIGKIGKLTPSNHPNEGYWGIRFKNARGALRSLELQNHVPHGLHFQLNSWNPMHMSVKTIRR